MRFLLLSFFLLFFAACVKDEQRTINRLDGEWIVVSYSVNGQALPAADFAEMRFDFKGCDSKEFDYCDGSVQLNASTTVDFKFSIGDSGDQFSIDFIALDLEDIEGTILSEKKTQTLSFSSGGETQEIVLERP